MPVTYFLDQYGSYSFTSDSTLGGTCLGNVTYQTNYRERVADRPNVGGKFSAGPMFDSLIFSVEGTLTGVDQQPGSIRAALDALALAFAPGVPQKFQIDDDRYAMAEVKSFSGISDKWKGLPYLPWTATLASYDDPPWWDVAVTTVGSLATDGSNNNFTVGGTGTAQPILTLVFSAAPANSTATIVDQLGNNFVVSPDAASTFILDSTQETITVGGVDKSIFATGDFPLCPFGANTLTITLAGGATISSATLSYQSRRY